MTDAIITLMALFTLLLFAMLVVAGGIRAQKAWFMWRTRRFVEQQERDYVSQMARLRSLNERASTRRSETGTPSFSGRKDANV